MRDTILQGDALAMLKTLPSNHVQTCVTSPPYYALRDYGVAGQIGLEDTPDAYIARLVEVFREVRRVLRHDGTLWVNIGDSYASDTKGSGGMTSSKLAIKGKQNFQAFEPRKISHGVKPKDLIGIPWLLAKALQQPYYTGKIANELDRVWLAATIDAEGCICGFTHERKDDGTTRTGIEITITNSSIALLDNAQRIWPTTRVDHNVHRQGHLGMADTYRWIAHNVDEKSILLSELYPYLIVKKKQSLLAWNFLEMSKEAKRLARTGEAQDVKDKRAWIVSALSRLNHFEDVDIPNWCKEPPSLYEPGWYLRSDVIWHKPNAMPESVTDRPTSAHEHVFLLAKSRDYFYDAQAIMEPAQNWGTRDRSNFRNGTTDPLLKHHGLLDGNFAERGRNKRTVWTISSHSYPGSHFATFPPKLVEPCILAGTSPKACEHCGAAWERVTEREQILRPRSNGGKRDYVRAGGDDLRPMPNELAGVSVKTLDWQPTCTHANEGTARCIVLDPFCGAGTVPMVALQHNRSYLGIELNPAYCDLIRERIAEIQPELWSA